MQLSWLSNCSEVTFGNDWFGRFCLLKLKFICTQHHRLNEALEFVEKMCTFLLDYGKPQESHTKIEKTDLISMVFMNLKKLKEERKRKGEIKV